MPSSISMPTAPGPSLKKRCTNIDSWMFVSSTQAYTVTNPSQPIPWKEEAEKKPTTALTARAHKHTYKMHGTRWTHRWNWWEMSASSMRSKSTIKDEKQMRKEKDNFDGTKKIKVNYIVYEKVLRNSFWCELNLYGCSPRVRFCTRRGIRSERIKLRELLQNFCFISSPVRCFFLYSARHPRSCLPSIYPLRDPQQMSACETLMANRTEPYRTQPINIRQRHITLINS